jgi:tetratricopeptide (TPR) repeat protein
MASDDSLQTRLTELRARGDASAAALWFETLPAEAALAELFGRRDDLSLLQKARFLLRLGRDRDAAEVLGELGDLPPGLSGVREELESALRGKVAVENTGEPPGLASLTLAELHASQGDRDAAIALCRAVLERDPADAQARSRLRELLEPGRVDPAEALGHWLERVRRWRRQHHN